MMTQQFGPWEDAVTREAYQKIIAIVRDYRSGGEDYYRPELALQAIEEAITETEGDEVW
jgi:hypothetical protein